MSATFEARPPGFLEFRQAVRRYRPSALVPAVARLSAALDDAQGGLRVRSDGRDLPWIASAIGREAVLYGNEYRRAPVTDHTVADLHRLFNETDDGVVEPSLAAVVTPLIHEQFYYEESTFEELSRVTALLEDETLGPPFDWSSLLGVELWQAVRAALILRVWVARNGGRYNPALLDAPQMQEVFQKAAPRRQIEATARALTTTPAQARDAAQKVSPLPTHLQRYAFNPLIAKPLVDLGPAGIWAPQTMLLERAMSTGNLFYRGIAAWGPAFAEALGRRVEAYTGKQLGLLAPPGSLSPEIEYETAFGVRKSVDWIWDAPGATVLVECKSARPTLGARAGDASLAVLVDRALVHARDQLDTTADQIRRGAPSFAGFSSSKRIVGLVVTCESFYLANSRLPEYGRSSTTPSLTISLRELEQWVLAPPEDAVTELLTTLDDPERRTWSLGNAFTVARQGRRNPLLAAAWERYAFEARRTGNREFED